MADATSAKAPTFDELPPHVRQFFADLKEEDVGLLRSGMEFARWFKTTGRFGKALVITGFSIFGAAVAAAQGWDYVYDKLWGKGP